MGFVFSKLFSTLFEDKELRILILGLVSFYFYYFYITTRIR